MKIKPTFFSHANWHTFLQSTVLTSVPGVLFNGTGPASSAGITSISSNAPSEKALASFTAQHSKVVSRGCISTNFAQSLLQGVVWGLTIQSFCCLWIIEVTIIVWVVIVVTVRFVIVMWSFDAIRRGWSRMRAIGIAVSVDAVVTDSAAAVVCCRRILRRGRHNSRWRRVSRRVLGFGRVCFVVVTLFHHGAGGVTGIATAARRSCVSTVVVATILLLWRWHRRWRRIGRRIRARC